ncbi:MAG: hypothetical protein WBB28_14995 [Crinalium sp.]
MEFDFQKGIKKTICDNFASFNKEQRSRSEFESNARSFLSGTLPGVLISTA